MVKKYFLKTFGCQMNYSDSERFATVLQNLGYEQTKKLVEADIIVINSCSVRQRAEDRVVGMGKKIKALEESNSDLKVILTGCMTKREKRLEKVSDKKQVKEQKELKQLKTKLPWVDIFLNIEDLPLLPTMFGKPKLQIADYFSIEPSYNSDCQAFVPISTGCNNFCSYCIVPFTRGPERSRSFNEIVQEVKDLVKNEYKEITLLGQNVNSYGNDLGEKDLFPKLLREIDNIEGNFWIRFISSHPKDISDELIETVANGKHLVHHIHFAMQSGNNNVLKRMNRPYTIEKYLELVEKIKTRIPQVAVTTDVIVGFPNETEEEFHDTMLAMKKAKFVMAYLNQYSPRKGTKSYEMKDNVHAKVKNERKFILNEILTKTSLEFNKQFLGKKVIALFTNTNNDGLLGHNAQGIDVKIDCHPESDEGRESIGSLVGHFAEVLITEVGSWGMMGKLATSQ